MNSNHESLELKASMVIGTNSELYKVIDFLNRNLKDENFVFGLSQSGEKMTISIYET